MGSRILGDVYYTIGIKKDPSESQERTIIIIHVYRKSLTDKTAFCTTALYLGKDYTNEICFVAWASQFFLFKFVCF